MDGWVDGWSLLLGIEEGKAAFKRSLHNWSIKQKVNLEEVNERKADRNGIKSRQISTLTDINGSDCFLRTYVL